MKTNLKEYFSKLLKNRRELTFLTLGFLMLCVVLWFLMSNISFLVDKFNAAFNINAGPVESSSYEFNLTEAKEILNLDIESPPLIDSLDPDSLETPETEEEVIIIEEEEGIIPENI